MRIIITGTPGTGKSVIAKRIYNFMKRLGIKYSMYEISEIIEKYKHYNGLVVGYDSKRDSKIVDEEKLAKILAQILKKNENIIIVGHLSHYINPSYVDLVIVTKCKLKTLYNRLKRRGYSKNKIQENVEAEIFDICYNECLERGFDKSQIIILHTDKNIIKSEWKRLEHALTYFYRLRNKGHKES